MEAESPRTVNVLCPKLLLSRTPGDLQWLIGSPFFPPSTVLSTVRCLHNPSDSPFSPDFAKESDDLRTLILRGFDLIGALYVSDEGGDAVATNASGAVSATYEMRRRLSRDGGIDGLIGAVADAVTGDVRFYWAGDGVQIEAFDRVSYGDRPESYVWEIGCLVRCRLALKLPVYVSSNDVSDREKKISSVIDSAAAKFRDKQVAYIVEGEDSPSVAPQPIVLRGEELDFESNISDKHWKNTSSPLCSYFCSENKHVTLASMRESPDTIRVTVLFNETRNTPNASVPVAEYFPALESVELVVISLHLDVLCFSAKELPAGLAVSKLVVPGLIDQLTTMKRAILSEKSTQGLQLCPYHFYPPRITHPIAAIYELSYGERELRQAEIRKSLHSRLGLPLDRPLLLIANSLNFGNKGSNSVENGSPLLKNVHTDIPSSGVTGGLVSLVDGSYEYYHYLQDGFDDNGWGCAYRSLQTIISWFRLQHYTSIEVPSHREIQQALVDIGDKEAPFVGSREWIGAIELSFVLDKLVGVTCKILNVRSGADLPEKCRELALHFDTQGTPIMIGGGVLAYTLLGVDYNETSGDCAFLILDPHYTGTDDLKKIVNGGWCGWKKAVDSKGKNFFLADKFYNLLLPQRPKMV
ncbi:putative Ufm1-specific protease [Acorus calamus]|uniref:Probable Ufm1-specific protease n=1 Tax=Acorus calamus TaxID=4465 RepID=A0AAV9F1G4_ACOCL|nr:putative Ufm1-specific protease [Acorus calamus]